MLDIFWEEFRDDMPPLDGFVISLDGWVETASVACISIAEALVGIPVALE